MTIGPLVYLFIDMFGCVFIYLFICLLIYLLLVEHFDTFIPWRGRLLAGQLCTDARTKDCKTYNKQLVRHFEMNIPFSRVQSKSSPCQHS